MGLRAGPLSDDKVIDRISTMFIPVAANLYEIRKNRGAGGDLFRSVQKQMDQYQGFWLVSPDGKALAKKHEWNERDPAKWPKELVETMDEILKAFSSVKPRQVKPTNLLPFRGTGVQPDGNVTLALYGRFLHNGQPDGPMTLDSVTLAAAEWAHFAPAKPIVTGQEWTVPESVARQLARGLSPGDSGGVFHPKDVHQAKFKAKVESIEGARARIRLSGEWKAEGLYGGEKEFPFAGSAKAEGIAIYDVEIKSMRSLLLVFSGRVWRGRPSEAPPEQEWRETGGVVEWTFKPSVEASAHGLDARETGKSPSRKVVIVSRGAYKAVVYQEAGGGIMEFYDLVQDPDAKWNLAGWDRGLFEVGWHGATFESPPEKKECCLKHMLEKNRDGPCYDGTRDWPSIGHKHLKAEGDLEVIEQNSVRVRVRAKSWFVWWSKYADRDLPVEAIYTFYPAGQIFVQVRVKRTGISPMHWSREYGPHLFVAAPKKSEFNPVFTFSTPKVAQIKDGFVQHAEELVLATSEKIRTSFLLTIPVELDKLFDGHMRHDGRSVGWDRAGYGSRSIIMAPGYDSTWACLIQMGTAGSPLIAELRTPRGALPYAMQYRTPPTFDVKGAEIVTNDGGDLDADGFNESEGCTVLRGKGPVELTYRSGVSAGFAPVFKIIGWQGAAPTKIKANGQEVPVIAQAVDGKLILQVLTTFSSPQVTLEIGK